MIPASRHAIYAAWLDTRQHSAFTGDTAVIEPAIGGRHSTFGGYASGTMLELEPHRRIVQSWRSTEFPEGSPDSRLEVTLEDTAGGTLVTILHTQIPEGQGDRYKDGWIQYYLEPLKRYFSKRVSNGVNGHRYGLAYAEKEDHVGDNERENDDELEMQGETDDQDDLDESRRSRSEATRTWMTTTQCWRRSGGSGRHGRRRQRRPDRGPGRRRRGRATTDEEADDDTVEVGADAIQEVSTEDAQRVVARPMEDDVRSPVVVEDMTGGYGKPAKARPKAKPARRAKAAARKPPARKAPKAAAKAADQRRRPSRPRRPAKPAAKPAKPAAKPAKKPPRWRPAPARAPRAKKAAAQEGRGQASQGQGQGRPRSGGSPRSGR